MIFDEIHERNLQADLALALTLDARDALRPDLRILAMSATLDTGRVAGVIGRDAPAPVITSEGRTHPVDVRWRPAEHHGVDRRASPRRRRRRSQHALQHDEGDVLVFLAGRRRHPPGRVVARAAVAGPTTSTSVCCSARCPSRSRTWRWPPHLLVAAGWSSPPTSPRPASRSRASGWSSTAARSAVLTTTRAAASRDCAPGPTHELRPTSAPGAPGEPSRGWPTASGPRWSRPLGDPTPIPRSSPST